MSVWDAEGFNTEGFGSLSIPPSSLAFLCCLNTVTGRDVGLQRGGLVQLGRVFGAEQVGIFGEMKVVSGECHEPDSEMRP